MGINWSFIALAWSALVALVLALAAYRFALARGEYTVLHVRKSELSLIPSQVRTATLLNRVDWWGRLLTAIALVAGLLVLALYLYDSAFIYR